MFFNLIFQQNKIYLLEDKRFYIYVYLDSRKSGKHVYGEYEFDHEPFYVSRGIKNRLFDHLNENLKNKNLKNTPKNQKIQNILNKGLIPIIIKYKENLTKISANKFEINMIKVIGSKLDNTGPLTNLSYGGDGGDTFTLSPYKEEKRKKLSERFKGNKNPNYGRIISDDERKRRSIQRKGYKYPLESCIRRHFSMKGKNKGCKNGMFNSAHKNHTAKRIKVGEKIYECIKYYKEENLISYYLINKMIARKEIIVLND